MNCRVSRQLMLPQSCHIVCQDCGAQHLDVFHSSKELGTHLCPTCFQARVERGMAREGKPALSSGG